MLDKNREISPLERERKVTGYTERRRRQNVYKQLARGDRDAFLNRIASEAEEDASKCKIGSVFRAVRIISGKDASSVNASIAKQDGSMCNTMDEVLDRCCEHYESALNHAPGSPCQVLDDIAAEAQEDTSVSTDEPTLGEVERAISTLRNGRAAGEDGNFRTTQVCRWTDQSCPACLAHWACIC